MKKQNNHPSLISPKGKRLGDFFHFAIVLLIPLLLGGVRGGCQNIGINTDGSAAETNVMLDVKGVNAKASGVVEKIFQIKSNDASGSELKLRLILGNNATPGSRYGAISVEDFAGPSYRSLSLQPSGGFVGIGTTTPGTKLHVSQGDIAATHDAYSGLWAFSFHATQHPVFIGLRGQGTESAPTYPLAGDVLSSYVGRDVIDGLTWTNYGGGSMYIVANENYSSANKGTYLRFNTTANGTNTETEKVRIDHNGNVGIGTPSPASKLHVFYTNPALTVESENQFVPVLTANQNANLHASWNTIQPGSAFNFNCDLYGSVNRIETTSGQTGTITGTYGSTNDVYNNGTGTITNAYGSTSYVRNISTGTITNAIGLQANVTNVSSGTITNGYGVFISSIQSTNKYSLFASDATAPSYFAGNVSMGDPTAYARLDVKGSGSTNATYGFGVRNSSDVYSLVVADNGNVGIGTVGYTAPLMPLHLHSQNNNFHAIRLTAENTTKYWDIVKRGNTYAQPDNFVIAYWNGGSWQEEFQITPAGNFGMGINNPTNKLEVAGNVVATGSVTATSNMSCNDILLTCSGTWIGATYTGCSDIRYKKDINPLENTLADVLKLKGVKYSWRQEEFPNMHFNDRRQIGFIAQEMEKVFPEIVNTNDKGYKSIDYAKLTPVLVEAIKELKAENDNLKAENSDILNEVKNLKADMEKIKITLATQASK